MPWSSDNARDHAFKMVTMLGTANGGGIAGIIALLQRPGSAPFALQLSGGLFLGGAVLAGFAQFSILAVDNSDPDARLTASQLFFAICLAASSIGFLAGATLAYLWAIGVKL